MLPTTINRVPSQSSDFANESIRRATVASIARYKNASRAEIDERLAELDAEWDVERTLEANAASAMMVGLTLGVIVDRRWFLFPTVVAGFLLQHALQGWCPPLPIFRRLGVRTSYEIDEERYALKAIRGDFQTLTSNQGKSSANTVHESMRK